MKDLFGKAILDYQTNNNPESIWTETTISSMDEMPVDYLFRTYKDMPIVEQKALDLAKGRILDVGAGGGSHSLILQEKGKDVTALEISPSAAKACELRGIKQVVQMDVLDYQPLEKFDTVLLLMNGTGIFQYINRIGKYLDQLKSLLKPNGQLFIDGTDLIYMYESEEDGGVWIPDGKYYGEVDFTVHYKGETGEPFPWLYLDFETLKNAATLHGFHCTIVVNGDEYNYLAKLTLRE